MGLGLGSQLFSTTYLRNRSFPMLASQDVEGQGGNSHFELTQPSEHIHVHIGGGDILEIEIGIGSISLDLDPIIY